MRISAHYDNFFPTPSMTNYVNYDNFLLIPHLFSSFF